MKQINVAIDPGSHAKVDRLAQQGVVTASWLVLRPMQEFLERHDQKGALDLRRRQVRRAAGCE